MGEKKKILVTASTFPRWMGDTEPRFILDYAKAMTQYYEIHLLVPMALGAKEEEVMEGVTVHRYHYFPIHKWETLCYPGAIVPRIKEKKIRILLVPFLLLSLKHSLKKFSKEVDLVHAHWLIPQGIMQAGIKDVPYILTGHGGDVTSLNFWPIKEMKIRTLKNAKYITIVSNALSNYVQDIYLNTKTSIIPMGCDLSVFAPDKKIDNYFDQGNKKIVLFVGRLEEIKGLKYLIEAIKDIDDVLLYIVGKGSLEDSLRKQAKGLEGKVIFAGAKTHKELPAIYASADVFVAPSITAKDGDKEGFGLVILEAMASGIPVIASRSGGITDFVKDGINGILCEEKDSIGLSRAINKINHDCEFTKQLIAEGLKTANENSYEAVAKRYSEIIDRALL